MAIDQYEVRVSSVSSLGNLKVFSYFIFTSFLSVIVKEFQNVSSIFSSFQVRWNTEWGILNRFHLSYSLIDCVINSFWFSHPNNDGMLCLHNFKAICRYNNSTCFRQLQKALKMCQAVHRCSLIVFLTIVSKVGSNFECPSVNIIVFSLQFTRDSWLTCISFDELTNIRVLDVRNGFCTFFG